jgi:hypothetical protein
MQTIVKSIVLSLLVALNVKLSFWIYFETIGYFWIEIDTFENILKQLAKIGFNWIHFDSIWYI